MSKKKSQKTTSSNDVEIDDWDDNLLVKAWEDAHKEYKKYHSIHRKGVKLEEVLTEDEMKKLYEAAGKYFPDIFPELVSATGAGDAKGDEVSVEGFSYDEGVEDVKCGSGAEDDEDEDAAESGVDEDAMEWDDEDEEPEAEAGAVIGDNSEQPSDTAGVEQPTVLPTAPGQQSSAAAFPPVENPELKAAMMAWYWAGYYTGVYDEQQKKSGEQT